jgi:O-antigen/teichoic acid export membrane protein
MVAAIQERENILQEIHTAVRHMAVYGIGNVLVKALGFLMLPFYTHYLSPKDYGVLEILDLSMSLFALMLNMGLTPAFLRCYAGAPTAEAKREVVGSGCLFGLATGVVTFLAGVWFVRPASAALFGSSIPASYLLISFSSIVVNYMANLPRTYLRALDKAGSFTMVDTAGVLLLLVLNIVFIAGLRMGVAGVLCSSLIVATLQFVPLTVWAFRKAGFHFGRRPLERMLSFGLPLIFANIGLFVLNFSDRFFLKHFWSLDVVGIYAVGYKFGFMMNYLFVQPFFTMWQTRMYAIHAQPEHPKIFKQIFALYTLGLLCAGLAMSLFSTEAVRLMVAPKFAASQYVIPVVVLSYVFYGLSYYAQLGMFLTDRTKLVGIIGAVAAAVNLVLNYFLIRIYGMMGAAWATLLSFAFIAVVSYICSQRVFRLPLGVGRMAGMMLLASALYLTCRIWAPEMLLAAVVMKFFVLAAFPVLAWKSGLLPPAAAETVSVATTRAVATMSRFCGAMCRRTVA